MLKIYFRSFIYTMGELSIIFIILSLIWSEAININHLYQMVGVVIPVHLFSFFTFKLKLFSKQIWIRRTIVIAFSLLVLLAIEYISGSIKFEFKSLVVYGIVSLGFIITTVFIFYVADKIEEQNLKLINQKLGEKNTSNIE